jgi:hypothetical protein
MIIKTIRRSVPTRFKPLNYLQRLVEKRTRDCVRAGPFKGQIIACHDTTHSMYVPKVLGLYERELHSTIEDICKSSPNTILNIGASDGYYAIGFSKRLPSANVFAFEADEKARDNLVKNAKINGIEGKIILQGLCAASELRNALTGVERPTIICDIEGHEVELLDLTAVPALRGADILVETHDFVVPGVTQLMRERFSASHTITTIRQQHRSAKDFPWRTSFTSLMPTRYLELAVSEGRPDIMEWLWMKPRL